MATVFISFVICVGVASWVRSGGVTAVFSVFKTPALIALIPALVFNITDVEVPIFLSRLSGLLGQAMIPVMLVTLGVQMGEIPKIKINFNVFAASTVRLIGGPVLATAYCTLFWAGRSGTQYRYSSGSNASSCTGFNHCIGIQTAS